MRKDRETPTWFPVLLLSVMLFGTVVLAWIVTVADWVGTQ